MLMPPKNVASRTEAKSVIEIPSDGELASTVNMGTLELVIFGLSAFLAVTALTDNERENLVQLGFELFKWCFLASLQSLTSTNFPFSNL